MKIFAEINVWTKRTSFLFIVAVYINPFANILGNYELISMVLYSETYAIFCGTFL